MTTISGVHFNHSPRPISYWLFHLCASHHHNFQGHYFLGYCWQQPPKAFLSCLLLTTVRGSFLKSPCDLLTFLLKPSSEEALAVSLLHYAGACFPHVHILPTTHTHARACARRLILAPVPLELTFRGSFSDPKAKVGALPRCSHVTCTYTILVFIFCISGSLACLSLPLKSKQLKSKDSVILLCTQVVGT